MTSVAELFFSNAALFALVASRVTGFIVVSPFPGQNVSTTQRISLVVVVSWLASTFAPATAAPRALDLTLAGPAVFEVACGGIIGVAFRLVYATAEVLGGVLGLATGLGTPSVLNPTLEAPDTVIGRIVTLGAMLVALSAGIHRIALGALLESFRALPVGSAMAPDAPMLRLVELWIDSFVVGVQLATPVIGVALLIHVALGVVSRAAPSLQIFSVGFTLLFATGIFTIIRGLDDTVAGLGTHFQRLTPFIDEALTAIRR
ncbi:MAG: flagellar biosynthetic protein FliR [Polyangiaceae bacterium]